LFFYEQLTQKGNSLMNGKFDLVNERTDCCIAEMPETERPRERLLEHGADALSNTELLAILLRTGSMRCSVLTLARRVLARFHGDLSQIARAGVSELRELDGIGVAKAVEINAAFALARRMSRMMTGDSPRLTSPNEVVDYMREALRGKRQEEFHALLLDTKHGVIRDHCVTVGLVDRSQVHAREVFRPAIREACSRVLLVHNHPSGDPTPSDQDVKCTQSLLEAGRIIGIDILDHVIIGNRSENGRREYISFREEGLLKCENKPK
jgi:DNA repair protein RadC